MTARTFRGLFCERFKVPLEAYEEAVFWRCLFPHAVTPAKIIWRLRRSYFAYDLELIRAVADCATSRNVRAEMSMFRYEYRVRGFCRRVARIRISGQKLLNLASLCLH